MSSSQQKPSCFDEELFKCSKTNSWCCTPESFDGGLLSQTLEGWPFASFRNRTGAVTLKTFKWFDAENLCCIEVRCFFQSGCLTQCLHAYPASTFHAASNFFLNAIRVREMTIKQWHSPPRPAPHVSCICLP